MFIKVRYIAILALRRFRVSFGCAILLACGLATVSAADCGGTGSVVCIKQGGTSAAQVRTWQDREDAERARQQAAQTALAKEEARLNKESKERRKIQEMQTERERQDKVNRDQMQQQLQRNLNNNGRK